MEPATGRVLMGPHHGGVDRQQLRGQPGLRRPSVRCAIQAGAPRTIWVGCPVAPAGSTTPEVANVDPANDVVSARPWRIRRSATSPTRRPAAPAPAPAPAPAQSMSSVNAAGLRRRCSDQRVPTRRPRGLTLLVGTAPIWTAYLWGGARRILLLALVMLVQVPVAVIASGWAYSPAVSAGVRRPDDDAQPGRPSLLAICCCRRLTRFVSRAHAVGCATQRPPLVVVAPVPGNAPSAVRRPYAISAPCPPLFAAPPRLGWPMPVVEVVMTTYPAIEDHGLIGDSADRGAGRHRRHDRLVLRAAVRLAEHLRRRCSTRRRAATSGSLPTGSTT